MFGGTKVVSEGENDIRAVVMHTGFASAKGQIIRKILLAKENSFSFYLDAIKFLAIMALIGLLIIMSTLRPMINQGYSKLEIFLRMLDLMTIAVPPALPAALTALTVYSL